MVAGAGFETRPPAGRGGGGRPMGGLGSAAICLALLTPKEGSIETERDISTAALVVGVWGWRGYDAAYEGRWCPQVGGGCLAGSVYVACARWGCVWGGVVVVASVCRWCTQVGGGCLAGSVCVCRRWWWAGRWGWQLVPTCAVWCVGACRLVEAGRVCLSPRGLTVCPCLSRLSRLSQCCDRGHLPGTRPMAAQAVTTYKRAPRGRERHIARNGGRG